MPNDVRIVVALVCLLAAIHSHANGVQQVICDDQTITLRGQLDHAADIDQRQPWESTGGKPVGRAPAGPFELRLPRFVDQKDRAYCSFVALDSASKEIGTPHYVQSIGGAVPSQEPYPHAASKKGLQVLDVDDALALGIKHGALNVTLNAYIDLTGSADSISFKTQGRTFYFHRAAVAALDKEVKELSDHGVIVTLIIYYPKSGDQALDKLMLHPNYDVDAPNHISAFNVTNEQSTEFLEACFEFLASRYSLPDHRYGRAVNFIVGNEVDSQWEWYNMGRTDLPTLAEQYARAVRLCHTAVRKYQANGRVFISLDHFWNAKFSKEPGETFPGRGLVEALHHIIAEQGDFDWNIAYHPYPENLFNPRFWLDKTATHNADTPRITFKNIEMLPQFLRSPVMLFDGQPRHVILSEQGFHTPDTSDGEAIQAAAYAYAWVRVNRTPGIDAFILHRQIDSPAEGGLHLGLWWSAETNPHAHVKAKKQIYNVFKAADTDHWPAAFQFALPIIGQKSWQAAP